MGNKYTDPTRTVTLSFISYAGFLNVDILRDDAAIVTEIRSALQQFAPDQRLIWGPAFHRPDPLIKDIVRPTDALMYIVADGSGEDDYTVVIRGTNPISIESWLFQDFFVGILRPWNDALKLGNSSAGAQGGVGRDAKVSQATLNSVAVHASLVPSATGEGSGNLLSFLSSILSTKPDAKIGFTGHSLGGLMAPVMACWVADQLNPTSAQIGAVGFAGPTAGEANFNSHLVSKVPDLARYANKYDIAVSAWNETTMTDLPNIYDGKPPMSGLLHDLWKLFLAMITGKGYQHPCSPIGVQSFVQTGDVLKTYYLAQAVYQHVIPYLNLAKAEARATFASYFNIATSNTP